MTIFTAGHGNRSFIELQSLLTEHGVTLLIDVRSKPYSRWVPHFNKGHLEAHLPMLYLWLPALGGKEMVSYDRFEEGIETVIRFSKQYVVCLMCAERRPEKCHRTTVLTPALQERGVRNIIPI